MTDLLFAGGNNHAGLFLIRCVPVIGLLSLPAPAAGSVTGAPTFKTGFNWLNLYGTEGSKSYTENQDETDNGSTWTVSVVFFLPGDSAGNRATLQEMVAHRFVVECQDNLGVWRRVGTIAQNLSLTYKFGVGPTLGDKRGATLTFSGVMTSAPPIIL